MDPITIGTAIGVAVATQLGKKIVEKGSDPDIVAKGINWVFTSIERFIQSRQKGKTPIDPPPDQAAQPPQASSTTQPGISVGGSAPQDAQVIPAASFRVEQIQLGRFEEEMTFEEIKATLNQLEIYLRNLRFEESKAAQYGGLEFAPIIVMNSIRVIHKNIIERVMKLNVLLKKAYGVSTNTLEVLSTLTEE